MRIDSKLWAERQWDVLTSFIYHQAYHRNLAKAYSESDVKSQFWRHTIDAHIVRAILNWSIIFGSEKRNEVHWKKVVVDNDAQSACRDCFLRSAGLSEEQWRDFWSSMTDFRNKYVAHRAPPYTPVPMMDSALRVVFAYDDWLRENMYDEGLRKNIVNLFDELPSLREKYEELTQTLMEPLRQLVRLGPDVARE